MGSLTTVSLMDTSNMNIFSAQPDEDEVLVGISLTCEAYISSTQHDICLGVVSIEPKLITIGQLRNLIISQLGTLPASFSFITHQGWPVARAQENTIRVSQLLTASQSIRVKRTYDKPRVGVKTMDGIAIGFVFCEMNCTLSLLRNYVRQDLGNISCPGGGAYQFMDRNGWPVGLHQENGLLLIDVLDCGAVRVCPQVFQEQLAIKDCDAADGSIEHPKRKRKMHLNIPSMSTLPSWSSWSSPGPDTTDSPDMPEFLRFEPKKQRAPVGDGNSIYPQQHGGTHIATSDRLEGRLRQLTFRSSKDADRPTTLIPMQETPEAKQILISYVRAEAAQQALALKNELSLLGYSVYLDVHEIKSGIDWQDALNFAVSNCEVFVPLVTPRYGQTQWTNREVKLADVLGKLIVPINFVENWPPKCLAIQFATTQFISWSSSTAASDTEANCNNAHASPHKQEWKNTEVRNVAQELGERVKQYDVRVRSKLLKKKASMLKSYAADLPDGMLHLSQEVSADRHGPPLIVISLHPKQAAFGKELRMMLEAEHYEVWCTTELSADVYEKNGIVPESPTNSQNSLDGDTQPLQMSHLTTSDMPSSSADMGRNMKFQEKANEAGVVIFVLSEAFAKSRTCQKQVFYCEHRKRVIPLTFEEFCMPGWMSMLIGTGVFEDARADGYKDSLKNRIQRVLDPNARGSQTEVNEEKIDCQVRRLRKKMPKGCCAYIAGSTSFFNKKSESICKAIGKHLAALEDISVVTGGFFGVGETIGRSYDDERGACGELSMLWHVLPERDDQDRSQQARQNKDRTFAMVPYGKTVYSGDSVREREVVVSRVFDICILVEGGPGAAHEAEQFSWNDHVVIPVKCTGGAAGGKFNVPEKIFKVPVGVSSKDWKLLGEKSASADDIGQAVAKIVDCIRERLKMDSPTYASSTSPLKSPLMSPLKSPNSLARQRSALQRMKTFQLQSIPSVVSPPIDHASKA